MVSIYIAIVITQLATPYIQKFFSGEAPISSVYIKADPTPFAIKLILFLAIVVLLTTKAGLAGMKARSFLSPIEVALYSALNSAMVLSTIISFLDETSKTYFISNSILARYINTYHDLWLIAPVIALVIFGFRRRGRHGELND